MLVKPVTEDGRAWVEANLDYEDWQRRPEGIAVEPRYVRDLLEGAQADGLRVNL